MNSINFKFSKFINYSLRVLFLMIVCGSIIPLFTKQHIKYISSKSIIITLLFISLTVFLICITYYALKKEINNYILLVGILLVGLVLRVFWFLNIDSIPVGDFNRMFICAGEFLDGGTYMFKETAYMARFPHMSITVLYFALIRDLFVNSLVAIKIINIVLSMFNIVLLYLMAKEIFNNRKISIWALLLSALYPPMIIYNNVYCSENIAIPLFLTSIFLLIKTYNLKIKNKTTFVSLILSGIFLGFTQLFRPIGYVGIIAYLMFIFIYFNQRIKSKFFMSCTITISFLIPYVFVSTLLINLNITENPLWKGTEPMSISILKGTNIDSGGRWNEEDSNVFYDNERDYEKVDNAAKEIIKERLTTTPLNHLIIFYSQKYINQWSKGDFGGAYWAENGLDEGYNKDEYLNMLGLSEGKIILRMSEDAFYYTQLFYVIILILSYIGLYRNIQIKNNIIYLLYIIYCGFSLQCLITESQDRYTYPAAWIFLLLAVTAFNYKANVNKNLFKISDQ